MIMYVRNPSAGDVAAALASGFAVEIWQGGSARYLGPEDLADELAAQGVHLPAGRGARVAPSHPAPLPTLWPSDDIDKERP